MHPTDSRGMAAMYLSLIDDDPLERRPLRAVLARCLFMALATPIGSTFATDDVLVAIRASDRRPPRSRPRWSRSPGSCRAGWRLAPPRLSVSGQDSAPVEPARPRRRTSRNATASRRTPSSSSSGSTSPNDSRMLVREDFSAMTAPPGKTRCRRAAPRRRARARRRDRASSPRCGCRRRARSRPRRVRGGARARRPARRGGGGRPAAPSPAAARDGRPAGNAPRGTAAAPPCGRTGRRTQAPSRAPRFPRQTAGTPGDSSHPIVARRRSQDEGFWDLCDA